jgi:Ferritin-like domain
VGSNQFSRGQDGRRGFGRAAVVLWVGTAAALLALGCGRSGQGADPDPEKGSDVAILDAALSRELTAASVYSHGAGLLRGRLGAVAREFHAQELQYVDAITKAIRGLGAKTEAEAERPDLSEAEGARGFLAVAYELENADLASYLEVAPRLYTGAPRALVTSLAAGHAQHLVVLRQALGAGLAASAPQAFDTGGEPPPGGAPPTGGR